MQRGTKVGQAYVALAVDGSNINRDIADEFDNVDFNKIGDEHGKSYRESFEQYIKTISDDIEKTLSKSFDKFDATGRINPRKRFNEFDKAASTETGLDTFAARIAAQLNDSGRVDSLIRTAGEKAGHTWGTGFDKEVRASVLDSLERHIQEAARRGNINVNDFVDTRSSVSLFGPFLETAVSDIKRVVAQVNRERETGEREWLSAQEKFAETGRRLAAKAAEANVKVRADAEREWLREQEKFAETGRRMAAQVEREIIKDRANAERQWTREQDKFAETGRRMVETAARESLKTRIQLERDWVKAQEDFAKEGRRNAEREEKALWAVRNASAKAYAKYLADLNKGRINERGETLGRGDSKTLGDKVGKLFGAGSRNNFLNTFGKSLGGLINITDKVRVGATKMFSTFMEGFKNAEQGASFFQKIGSGFSSSGAAAGGGISKAFSSLAASGPAAAAAVVAVTVALAAMVSVASALLAIVVALAATIASALVGALAVAGGGMLALVAAGGLLINMFTSMTDAQKKLMSEAFAPLKDLLTGLGQLMLGPVMDAFGTWAANLQAALGLLIPLADVMGQAFARAGTIITASLSGPGFQSFIQSLTEELPQITENLASALGGFLNGLLGLFAVLMPYVTQFSKYLADVADDFSKWANSTAGQNAISDFVDRAVLSLQSLWGFIKETGGLIADLLFSTQGQEAGNSIFDGLTDAIKRLRAKIAEFAANGKLEEWFQKGVKFGKALGKAIEVITGAFAALDSSGVLDLVTLSIKQFTWEMKILVPVIEAIMWPIQKLADLMDFFADKTEGSLGRTISAMAQAQAQALRTAGALDNLLSANGRGGTTPVIANGDPIANLMQSLGAGGPKTPSVQSVINSGNSALAQTDVKSGGRKGPWKNPWQAWAESLIKNGPSTAAQIKAAIAAVNKQAQTAIRTAMRSTDSAAVKSSLQSTAEAMIAAGKSVVETAQNALNSAAQALAGASSPAEAKRALAAVRRAQADLAKALKDQKRLNAAAKIVNAQRVVSADNVRRLLDGLKAQNATLADYARARELLAEKIKKAQEKLEAAIALRDDFSKSVADSVKAYGSLVSAQAQTLNGVQQALTADDVIGNLQSRLDKIKTFQDNLRTLVANGLSDAAYKQLLEAGVEGGFDTVQALVNGGTGAIQQVNDLIGKIGSTGDALGKTAADKLYQAGVDAAQGLLDGLNSLDDKLEAAATALGNRIATAVKNALGIHSPSTVMIGAMGSVGDGVVVGLDGQHDKVGAAGKRFGEAISSAISVSPEVARYEAAQRQAGVSGNAPTNDIDITVITPTEDPRAVAMETMNEVMGRI